MASAIPEALLAQFIKNPEVWRAFFPPGFQHPRELDPNYVVPNTGPLMKVTSILNIILAIVVVIPRLISRVYVVRNFKIDDWFIIPAFIAHIANCVTLIWAIDNSGLGKHVYDCTPSEIENWFRTQYAANIIGLTGLFVTRVSILFFLRTLAGNTERKSRIAITIVQIANAIHWPCQMLPTVFMCTPEFRNWSLLHLISSTCMEQNARVVGVQTNSVVFGAFGVVLDVALLVIPIRLVWQLRLPVRQRIIVSALFAVGSLACIASALRAAYTGRQLRGNGDTYDLSWTFVPIFVAGEFEQTFALVSACGPGLKPLFSRVFPLLVSTLRGGSSGTGEVVQSREVTGGTIGGSGAKKKVRYASGEEESIGMSSMDSRSSIIQCPERSEGTEEWKSQGRAV